VTFRPRNSTMSRLSSRVRRGGRGICFSLIASFGLFLVGGPYAEPIAATIQYEVSLAKPAEHLFHVTMTVPDVHGELTLQMPAWNALYQIRDFSSRVQNLTVESNGKQLAVKKLDKLLAPKER
jgi:hypothetical protein